ncbi:hypothetical protein [Halocynthiibacter namhaensis]|uniref:hypothetical protein n=1 Tax=Halocynthiibacter namhaensis TaxID=1290553 RepID=UPI000578FF97|nr:hypothetical protein [Halocynthiibacter namhaensis]
MKIWLVLAAIWFGVTQPAVGAPDRWVAMDEQIIGQNETHFFVLRKIEDNLGYHSTTKSDVYLISRNLFTGIDERIWPVMRTIDHGAYYFQNGHEQRVENLGAGERVNPFDILLWRQAWRVLPREIEADRNWLEMDAIVLEEGFRVSLPSTVYEADMDPMFTALKDSTTRTRRILNSTSDRHDWDRHLTANINLLASGDWALEAACEIDAVYLPSASNEGAILSIVAKVVCGNAEEDGGFSYWTVLPVVETQD